jgi:PiT family inorganic phosphate transporter
MTLLILIIILALVFDYINGFHDAANSIATIVSTKVLTPFQAVVWAAVFNFGAYFISKYIIGEFGIGNTVAKSVFQDYINLTVILAGLVAAISWNLLTWWYGIPSSSSHTLIGGFGGAAIAYGGFKAVNFAIVGKIAMFIFLAPFVGMLLASIINITIINLAKNSTPSKADSVFRKLQLVSSAAFSLGHGGNDAQKVMGIIGVALIAQGIIPDLKHVPDWVPLACLGTLSGGWRIVKTMGTRITKVTPLEGVSAETAGALTLYLAEWLHIPVSTTHTITGSIIGVGLTKRVSAVKWGVTINLLWAWILTIPVSALIGGTTYFILSYILK